MKRFAHHTLRAVIVLALVVAVAACYRATSPLQGEDAPGFTLPLLGGGELDLAAHEGEDIVVLDFWATWCGPCRKGLPAMAEVAKAFEGRPVAVYGINLGDSDSEVQNFLESANIDLAIAMDRDGEVGKKYAVQSIPTTLVLDREGVVRHSHIGYSSGLVSEMTQTIEAMLKEGNQEQ